MIEELLEDSIDSTQTEDISENTESTSIEDLPSEIWSLDALDGQKTNSIRFAEDIDELGRSNSPSNKPANKPIKKKTNKNKTNKNKNTKKGK